MGLRSTRDAHRLANKRPDHKNTRGSSPSTHLTTTWVNCLFRTVILYNVSGYQEKKRQVGFLWGYSGSDWVSNARGAGPILVRETRIPYARQHGQRGGLPGGPGVENLPCGARDTSLIPGWGKIPRAVEQRSPWATTPLQSLGAAAAEPYVTTTEAPMPPACAAQQEKPPQWETSTRASLHKAMKTQCGQK